MRILYEGGYFTCYFVWCNSFCLSAWLCKAMSYYSKINKSWLVENIKGMILDNDYFDVINNIPKESFFTGRSKRLKKYFKAILNRQFNQNKIDIYL